jgi:HK97 family phage major capsid protein
MPFNNILSRSDTAALVPEEVANDMLGHVATQTSATLQTFRRVPVASGQVRFPILSALPVAYWVAGDTGLKQTTEEQWSNKFLNIEEMAVIVPVPENVLDDVGDDGGFDLWGEVQPDVEIAIGRTLDDATFFGVNAPATFPTSVSAACAAQGTPNTFAEAATQAEGGIQDDIDACIALLEPQGFDPTHIVANRTLRSKLRRARSTIGERLSGVNPDISEYLDLGIVYPMRGLFPTGAGRVEAFVGDYSEFVVGVRKDVSFKLLTEAVIQDGSGNIVYNLAQQDMVAMRFTFRVGWQVSNRIRYDQPDETKRYPVATLTSAS